MALFSRIKETAKEQGLLLKDVAEKVGTTAANMTRWDKNRPSVDKVVSAAQVLNVSVDYLLELTDEKTPAANGGDGLDDKQKQLLSLFARLPAATQESVIAQLQGLVQYQEARDARLESE